MLIAVSVIRKAGGRFIKVQRWTQEDSDFESLAAMVTCDDDSSPRQFADRLIQGMREELGSTLRADLLPSPDAALVEFDGFLVRVMTRASRYDYAAEKLGMVISTVLMPELRGRALQEESSIQEVAMDPVDSIMGLPKTEIAMTPKLTEPSRTTEFGGSLKLLSLVLLFLTVVLILLRSDVVRSGLAEILVGIISLAGAWIGFRLGALLTGFPTWARAVSAVVVWVVVDLILLILIGNVHTP